MATGNSEPADSLLDEAKKVGSGDNWRDRLFDISFSILLLILTAWLFMESPNLISKVALEPDEIPPIFFPRIILFILFCLSLVVLAKQIFGQSAFRLNLTLPGLQRMIVATSAMFAYLLIFKHIGFILSTALFTFAMTWYYGNKSWPKIIALTIIFPPIVNLIFDKIFHIFLPKGLF